MIKKKDSSAREKKTFGYRKEKDEIYRKRHTDVRILENREKRKHLQQNYLEKQQNLHFQQKVSQQNIKLMRKVV